MWYFSVIDEPFLLENYRIACFRKTACYSCLLFRISSNCSIMSLRLYNRFPGSLDYWNNHTKQLFKTDPIASSSFFEDGIVVVLSGDVNALKPETRLKIGKKPLPFPNEFDTLLQAGANLKGMVKNILYENRCILN